MKRKMIFAAPSVRFHVGRVCLLTWFKLPSCPLVLIVAAHFTPRSCTPLPAVGRFEQLPIQPANCLNGCSVWQMWLGPTRANKNIPGTGKNSTLPSDRRHPWGRHLEDQFPLEGTSGARKEGGWVNNSYFRIYLFLMGQRPKFNALTPLTQPPPRG